MGCLGAVQVFDDLTLFCRCAELFDDISRRPTTEVVASCGNETCGNETCGNETCGNETCGRSLAR